MYDKFTDRARKIMQLANQEAQRFNHEFIGTEHIILGMVKEGTGVAAHVFKERGIDLRKIRLEVEKAIRPGPDMVTMGKLPQTPRAKKVVEYAMEEARNLNHNYVGDEHILIGLLREHDGIASQVLLSLGVTVENARIDVLDLLGLPQKMTVKGSDGAGSNKFLPLFSLNNSPPPICETVLTVFGLSLWNGCDWIQPTSGLRLDERSIGWWTPLPVFNRSTQNKWLVIDQRGMVS